MENKPKQNYLITATYKSGRTEEFRGKLLKDEKIPKMAIDKLMALEKFPTVISAKIERY